MGASILLSDGFRCQMARIGTTKALSFAWMAGKQEFSAVVVKAFKSFFQLFSVPDGEPGQSCGELELEVH